MLEGSAINAFGIEAGNVIHRAWQGLPYTARRRLLFRATALIASKPKADCQLQQPIFIAGFLKAATGLGECARVFHEGYRHAGAEVYGIDLSRPFRQDGCVAEFNFEDGRRHRGPGTVMLHVSGPLIPLALSLLGRRFLKGKWRIAYWAWELPQLPLEWLRGAEHVHELRAISQFTASAVAESSGDNARVVTPPVMRHAITTDRTRQYRHRTGAEFVVLTAFDMASSFARKNPLAAIAAFRLAFGSNRRALLIVKVSNGDAYPAGAEALKQACRGCANIVLISDTLSNAAFADLIFGSDVVLSLHRSEGFGLVLAQAMQCGRAIVTTNWSGSREFLHPGNACLVSAELVSARDPQRTYDHHAMCWAEPSIEAAAQFLLRLMADRAFAGALGKRAQQDAAAIFSPSLLPQIARAVN